jgi:hypothetical protein
MPVDMREYVSAIFYTLCETARVVDLDPQAYLSMPSTPRSPDPRYDVSRRSAECDEDSLSATTTSIAPNAATGQSEDLPDSDQFGGRGASFSSQSVTT